VKATLTELHRQTRRVIRPVIDGGQKVILTDQGQDVAEITQLHRKPNMDKILAAFKRMGELGLVIPPRDRS